MVPLKKFPAYSSWSYLAFMSIGAFICSVGITCVTGQFNFHPVGIGCGLLWVFGGALCFWAVQAEADLAGTGLRSMSVSILLSFFSGVVIFQEKTLLYYSIPAIACMIIGIWIPASKTKSIWKNWRSLMSGAVFGTYLIPFKFSGMGDMEFLFPFSFGVCIGSLVLVGLVTFRRHKDIKHSMIAPTLISIGSGIMWMFGTLAIFWTIADDGMFGYAVGYPLLQLNLVVNQLWGVFVFGEYASRGGRIKLAMSTVVILIGAVLLTLSKM